jgi:DNA repair protein RadC
MRSSGLFALEQAHLRAERPAERMLRAGVASLSDAELLAVLLVGGRCGTAALDLADALLVASGGLHEVFAMSPAQLGAIPGIGRARVARLEAAIELGRRYLSEPLRRGSPLKAPSEAAQLLQAELADLPHEVFGCLYLDTRHRLIGFERLFRGTIDGATVHPREVVKRALHHNAAALIVGHNHPSGVAEPSESDRGITRRLGDALELVGIRLLDHLIVSRASHVSLAERGWI